jgi:release factor glutamine methyltransferase
MTVLETTATAATRRAAWTGGIARLRRAGVDAPERDALCLLARALAADPAEILADPDFPLDPGLAPTLDGLLRRREHREPLARILGEKEFHSLPFAVRPGVFVPRPETEGLADLVLDRLRAVASAGRTPRLLDLCTGAGVLAVTAARRARPVRVWAVDICPAAVRLARHNARRLGVTEAVQVLQGDLFGALSSLPAETVFDVIVANPPYVPSEEIPGLMPEVSRFDPIGALDGGPDGLRILERILRGAPERLVRGGTLLVEIGEHQGEAGLALARTSGAWGPSEVHPDLAGRSRYLVLHRSG